MRDLNMLKWLWLSLLAVILDQASKLAIAGSMQLYQSIEIVPYFNLTYVHNTGAAFSFLSEAGGWQRWFFAGLALVISVVIAVWLARLKRHETLLAVALSLILGGAIGNLIDRLAYGYVIDFLDVYYQTWHWPAFNIADSAITLGVILMLVESFGLASSKESKNSQD
jgi:signal peptidase II